VSWLKKNELDLKRHVQDLRDNIRTNWTTTGQELSKELRQFWPPGSRPQSPAPRGRLALQVPNGAEGIVLPPSSPLPSPSLPPGVPKSPGTNTNDFVAGYALGLIGGVRSWVSFSPPPQRSTSAILTGAQMTKSRRTDLDSRPPSDDDSEESEDKEETTKIVVPTAT